MYIAFRIGYPAEDRINHVKWLIANIIQLHDYALAREMDTSDAKAIALRSLHKTKL